MGGLLTTAEVEHVLLVALEEDANPPRRAVVPFPNYVIGEAEAWAEVVPSEDSFRP